MVSHTITGNEHMHARGMNPVPLGEKHLHLTCPSGHWVWGVREGKNGNDICNTDRCVPVTIFQHQLSELASGPES